MSGQDVPLRLGIVGFGNAGRQHLAAAARVPAVRVVAVADPAAPLPAGLRHYSDAHALIESPDVDAVALCTPPGPRAQLALRAIAAGKPMVVEKPVARSIAEFDRLVTGVAAGLPATVMLQHRLRLSDAVLEHDWGAAVGVLEVSRPRDRAHYEASVWRADAEAAYGGVTAHLGIHYLDLACQLLGDVVRVELDEVHARHPGIDTRVAGTVEFARGGLLHFTVTSERPDRRERLAITAAGAELHLVDGLLHGRLPGRELGPHPAPAVESLRAAVYADFAAAVGERVQPARCGLVSARPVTRIVAQIADALAPGAAARPRMAAPR